MKKIRIEVSGTPIDAAWKVWMEHARLKTGEDLDRLQELIAKAAFLSGFCACRNFHLQMGADPKMMKMMDEEIQKIREGLKSKGWLM